MRLLKKIVTGVAAAGLTGMALLVWQPRSATYAQAPTPRPQGGGSIGYPSGWNLTAGPSVVADAASDPLYTLQPGDSTYETVSNTAQLQPGLGYWAYFRVDSSIVFPTPGAAQAITRPLPAGQFVMIGNPFGQVATVTGADAVFTYSAARGYSSTASLRAGEGAWAYSASGGTVTISLLQQ